MPGKKLLFRADAGLTAGAGHVMRCLALAQAWQEAGGKNHFLLTADCSVLEHRLHDEGMEVACLNVEPGGKEDASVTARTACREDAAWIVVDGYCFSGDYQRALKEAGFRLLGVDDLGAAGHYWADAIVNPNVHAHESLYVRKEASTQLFLGPRFVWLRREFLRAASVRERFSQPVRKLLVTLGGSDPANVTMKILRGIEQLKIAGLETVVAMGALNPHQEDLGDFLGASRQPIRLLRNVTNMAEWLAWADVVVCGAGSTCWETAFMGRPAVVVILAENQKPVAERLAEWGAVVNWGWHEQVAQGQIAARLEELLENENLRMTMAAKGRELVDGHGAARLVGYLARQETYDSKDGNSRPAGRARPAGVYRGGTVGQSSAAV